MDKKAWKAISESIDVFKAGADHVKALTTQYQNEIKVSNMLLDMVRDTVHRRVVETITTEIALTANKPDEWWSTDEGKKRSGWLITLHNLRDAVENKLEAEPVAVDDYSDIIEALSNVKEQPDA
jgi:rubrerythrin